jgi:PPOX class probable F420-dependent enzyme
MFSEDARRMLDGRCFAHLATLQPDGSPKVEPVWVGREGERVLIATDERTLKGRNMARDARVALSITAPDDPYEQLLIRGRVVEIRPDRDLAGLDALSHKYLGRPFPRRNWPSRALYVIEPKLARYYRSPLGPSGAGGRAPARPA